VLYWSGATYVFHFFNEGKECNYLASPDLRKSVFFLNISSEEKKAVLENSRERGQRLRKKNCLKKDKKKKNMQTPKRKTIMKILHHIEFKLPDTKFMPANG
jgi:hypothetical protein